MTTVIQINQVFIRTSLQTAFDYVSDLAKHPEWSGGELKIQEVTAGPIAVGKEYASKGAVAIEKERPNQLRVAEYEPPRKFGFVAKDRDFGDVHHVFTFNEQNGGVMVTRSTTFTINALFAFAHRLLIYPTIGRPMDNKAFSQLKAKLE